jgi:hypothetical protein
MRTVERDAVNGAGGAALMPPKVPTAPGFYWAKWRIADADVDRMYDYTPSSQWDVVEVYYSDGHEGLRAYICGIPGSHSLEGFHWSPDVLAPPASAPRNLESPEQVTRRAYAKYRAMTPDEREEFLQRQRRALRPAVR